MPRSINSPVYSGDTWSETQEENVDSEGLLDTTEAEYQRSWIITQEPDRERLFNLRVNVSYTDRSSNAQTLTVDTRISQNKQLAAVDIDLDGKVPEPIDGIVTAGEQVSLTADAELSGYVIASDVYEDSSMVTESKILENFTVTYNDLKNPFLNDQTKILSWKQ